ncbi:uncharacterized protein BJ171DRAFT_582525 [Polychytrium aggregatum]|uniref:uncharacterized protein n=1 Tax=Polychytrium aggregatum TaxID=110093 RepID=UPI0022FE9849|nr:uncharacterized protein BJ171DRAFT_582525 [Polychytrium aggregatum]KAI9203758.1 hypothetical protein BJ171DRAFT_582525 [Polychytrium aggregatum]
MLPPCLIRAAGRPSTILRRQAPTIFRALPASQMLSTRMVAADPADTLMPPSSWPPAIPRRWMSSGRPGSRNNDRGPSNDRNSDRRNSDHPSNDRDRSFRSSRSPSASGPSTRPTSRFGSSSRPSSGEKNTKQSHGTHSTQRPWSKEPRTAETHSKHSPKTLSPSLSRPSVQASQALQTPLDPHQAGRPAGRLEWHSDPKNLGTRLKALIRSGQIDEAWDLIDRHTGATNDVVFAEAIQAFKDHGHYGDAIEAFKLMKRRKIVPTPSAYTGLINGAFKAVTRPDVLPSDRSRILQQINAVWEDLPNPSTIHANAMLKLCVPCAYEGGWKVAIDIFDGMMLWTRDELQDIDSGAYNSQEPTFSYPPPDSISFSTMLQLCGAFFPSSKGYSMGLRIMNDLENILDEPPQGIRKLEITNIYHGIQMDSHIAASFLLLCAKSGHPEAYRNAQVVIQKYLDLPSQLDPDAANKTILDEWSEPHREKLLLTPTLMFALLRLASATGNGCLGLVWFDIFQRRKLECDDGILNLAIMLCAEQGRFDRAAELNQHTQSRSHAQNSIRIASLAVALAKQETPTAPLSRKWLQSASDAVKSAQKTEDKSGSTRAVPYLTTAVFRQYIELLMAYNERAAAAAVVERYGQHILMISRRSLDNYKAEPGRAQRMAMQSGLEQTMECLQLCKVVLQGCLADADVRPDRRQEAEAMIDNINSVLLGWKSCMHAENSRRAAQTNTHRPE